MGKENSPSYFYETIFVPLLVCIVALSQYLLALQLPTDGIFEIYDDTMTRRLDETLAENTTPSKGKSARTNFTRFLPRFPHRDFIVVENHLRYKVTYITTFKAADNQERIRRN